MQNSFIFTPEFPFNVNTAAKFPRPKFVLSDATFQLLPCTKWGIAIETLVSRYRHITQEKSENYEVNF